MPDPTSRTDCLTIAQRAAGGGADWTPEDWQAQLDVDAVTRAGILYYRPYRSATAYLVSPDRVKMRMEGQFQEQYIDLNVTLNDLRSRDSEWCAQIPAQDDNNDGTPDEIDLSTQWTGWS